MLFLQVIEMKLAISKSPCPQCAQCQRHLCMSSMIPTRYLFYATLSETKGRLSDLWLLDLQELEYCLLKQRKTHTGTMQTLCKYFYILIDIL